MSAFTVCEISFIVQEKFLNSNFRDLNLKIYILVGEVKARGGVLTYLAKRGCAALMGLFITEILKHRSRFLPKKSLNMGQLFWLSPKFRDFRVFAMQKPLKLRNFWKIGLLFG